ncbi:hypothetical protein [Micromonospora sp. RP3T]|uniref:hypothetical protein n=1 Tax=Micromonospora sp. RP3T TaxID=2135446 RepID=UPI000D155CAB|nr:hypothetical protein [Micromonospora sp. RP3T]PTA48140.1 hypothetical protein C8054_00990 [Micromonospora sp. RP3T]
MVGGIGTSGPLAVGWRPSYRSRTAARVLAQLSAGVKPGGVTVSAEDAQRVHHWVFCDRPLPDGGGRCALPADHVSACARRAPWLRRR